MATVNSMSGEDYVATVIFVCLSAVVGGMLCKSDKPSIIIIIISHIILLLPIGRAVSYLPAVEAHQAGRQRGRRQVYAHQATNIELAGRQGG